MFQTPLSFCFCLQGPAKVEPGSANGCLSAGFAVDSCVCRHEPCCRECHFSDVSSFVERTAIDVSCMTVKEEAFDDLVWSPKHESAGD